MIFLSFRLIFYLKKVIDFTQNFGKSSFPHIFTFGGLGNLSRLFSWWSQDVCVLDSINIYFIFNFSLTFLYWLFLIVDYFVILLVVIHFRAKNLHLKPLVKFYDFCKIKMLVPSFLSTFIFFTLWAQMIRQCQCRLCLDLFYAFLESPGLRFFFLLPIVACDVNFYSKVVYSASNHFCI